MKAYGITGGIGAGKSLITRIFAILDVSIYDADSRAKRIMNASPTVTQAVKDLFGEESYRAGELDRAHVAKIAFHNPEKLEALNGIVHPAVARDFDSWQSAQKGHYVLKEAALLYETGSYKELEGVIVVDAPETLRIERVLKRDPHRDEAQVQAIIAKQMDNEQKVEMADYVIINDGLLPVIPQVLKVHQDLCR